MSKVKIEGMKDDLDVVAIAKAFDRFKDAIQLISDKADQSIIDLPFETSLDGKKFFEFKQEEAVSLKDVTVNLSNKKIMFVCVYGASDKIFYQDDAELITVSTKDDATGNMIKKSFSDHAKEAFAEAFDPDIKISSLRGLQAMISNNPPLADILNDTGKFLEDQEKVGARGAAYLKLEKFGRY